MRGRGDSLERVEFAAWFRLAQTPGLGRAAARSLLASFGSAPGVLAATPEQRRLIVPARACEALERPDTVLLQRLETAWLWLAGAPDRHAVVLGDARFPAPLLETADPPLMLFVEGEVSALSARCLAIVGSRRPTPQGRQDARVFASELAGRGYCVVSGLAQGIDRAAHEGALSVPGGRTVAVIGTGPDLVYPPAHAQLARQIVASGAIVSEYAPGTPPLAENFPRRNRIIAGLASGVLVVEAALRSGSLITARLALEAGRDVFAVPGSIHSAQSRGCHQLIKDGAALVESVEDLLPGTPNRPAGGAWNAGSAAAGETPSDRGAPEDPLLAAVGDGPTSLDAICDRTGLSAAEASARLLEMELSGLVARLPGGLYQRTRMG